MSAMQFVQAAAYGDNEAAKQLRSDLERMGLVHVEPATINGKPGQLVSATTPGRKVAEILRGIGKPALRFRALRTLYALSKQGPMTTRTFIEASRYTPPNAKVLREDLEEWGLVAVADATVRGATHRISLTPAGQRVAEQCAEIVRIIDRAAKKDA